MKIIMFLNTDTFNYGGHSIVLSELSALQRVDYLKFIQQRTADYDAQPETLTEAERQTEFMQMGVDINAWLVSRSLCESKKRRRPAPCMSPSDWNGLMRRWDVALIWFCP